MQRSSRRRISTYAIQEQQSLAPCAFVTVNNQAASLTEDDIARIADRERHESRNEQKEQNNGSDNPEVVNRGDGSRSAIAPDDPLVQPGSLRIPMGGGAISSESSGSLAASLSKSRLLMGVPVAMGPNATKFLYVEVPEDSKEGHDNSKGHGSGQFRAEQEASRLCGGLHDKDNEGEEFSTCLSSLTITLTSR